jgi:glycosyltransferase involved in cell wall biosynthesis
MKKSVLALRTSAYPNTATATRRFESFCRYLQEDGHQVTVLALAPEESSMLGKSYLDSKCNFEVIQIPGVARTRLRRRIEAWVARRLVPEMEYDPTNNRTIASAANCLLQERKFDCLLTTYPSMGALVLSDRLSKRYDLPWIADLRDIPDEIDVSRERWYTRRAVRVLSVACESAAHILTVSEPLAMRLRNEYSISKPITTIYNGFEPDDFPQREFSGSVANFRITYCGNFGCGRSLILLYQALDKLKISGADLSKLEVHIYSASRDVDSDTRSKHLDIPICFHGRVPHAEAIENELRSGILLSLASPNTQGVLTSKIFEYAMIGRPVLNIPAGDNALDEFISKAQIGLSSSKICEIADFIAKHLCAWRSTGCLPVTYSDRNFIAGFSRRTQADKLTALIDSL